MLLVPKSQIHLMHGSQDINNMDVDDDAHLLENCAWIELKLTKVVLPHVMLIPSKFY